MNRLSPPLSPRRVLFHPPRAFKPVSVPPFEPLRQPVRPITPTNPRARYRWHGLLCLAVAAACAVVWWRV